MTTAEPGSRGCGRLERLPAAWVEPLRPQHSDPRPRSTCRLQLCLLLTVRLACLRSLALCLVRSVKNTEVHSAPSRRHARIARWLQAGPSAVLASSPWACPSSSGRPPETGSARCRGLLLGRRARAAPRDSRVPVSTHGCFRALACRCCPSGLNRCLLGNGGSEGGHPQNHNVAILKCASQMPLGKLAAVLSHLRAV